jgi:pyruvate dehydrogenase E1 component alpha subunit/2-oxoisovalerate dehydrogenase E1 component alpha subunit
VKDFVPASRGKVRRAPKGEQRARAGARGGVESASAAAEAGARTVDAAPSEHGSAFAAFKRPPLTILRPDGVVDAACDPRLEPALLLRIHRAMSLLRVLDERMLGMQRQGRIGFYGACSGQEAAVIGSAAALRDDEWVFPALREGGIMLWRGYPLEPYLAQIFGNALDPAKGRQMPSHMSDARVRQVSWSSCIGSQLPQAVGAAWAARLRRESCAVATFLGDGATSSADFHCAMNFAGVFALPIVIVCQNNGWSISVPTKSQTATATIAQKAIAYGIPGHRVDGNDVLAVYATVRAAAERARRGEGPSFIECVTYRLGAHSSSDDPTRYRDEVEVAHWRSLDPLIRLRAYLERERILAAGETEALTRELDTEVRAALARVEDAPPPARATLFDDVYAELPWHLAAQRGDDEPEG